MSPTFSNTFTENLSFFFYYSLQALLLFQFIPHSEVKLSWIQGYAR